MSDLAVGKDSQLPKSWISAAIADVATLSPKFSATDVDVTDLVHFVPMASVAEDFEGIDTSQLRPYGQVRKGYTYFSEGDVLFAKITPCMENGKGALVPHLPQRHAFGSTEFHVLRSQGSVQPKWLAHYLSQPDFRKVARSNMAGTAGQLRVPTKWLAAAGIPLAPCAEQARIVEKLEELLSDLDAGVAELMAAQRKLALYRQSLLKAAVEGALTADWRAAHHDNAEPTGSLSPRKRGSMDAVAKTSKSMDSRLCGNDGQSETGAELLQRILTERRARWQAKQLSKFSDQGKTPPKDWQGKYKEPVAPGTIDLPALPEGWVWGTIDQIADVGTGVTPLRSKKQYFEEGTIPWVTSGALNDPVVTAANEYVTPLALGECRLEIYPAGSLLVAMYGEGKTRGKCSELRFPATINQAIAAIVLEGEAATVRGHLKTFLLNAYEAMRKQASGGVQPNLNLQIIKGLSLPLPPLDEQAEVQLRLSDQLLAFDAQQLALDRGLKQAAVQRKNILKAAFTGQLVPQDPNDEPASVLLDRIRAERAAEGTTAKKRGRTPRKTA